MMKAVAVLLVCFFACGAGAVGDDECSTATSCMDCSKMATCAWCASREPDFHGTCGPLADARTGCNQGKNFIVTSTSDKYTQECCSYQTNSCTECVASGGAWGEMKEAYSGRIHSRCWTQSGCQAEMLSFQFSGGDKYNIKGSACHSDSCDGVYQAKLLGTDDSPLPPIAFTFPEDDHCANSKTCLGCERTEENKDDCRWCFAEDLNFHGGSCIGTGKGLAPAEHDYCPPTSQTRLGDDDACSVQTPTCHLCTAHEGVWGVMYYIYLGDETDLRVVRRCYSKSADCQKALSTSGYVDGSTLTRLCSSDCSKFSTNEREGTNYYKKESAALGTATTTIAAIIAAAGLTTLLL